MWILPKQLHTSHFVPATEALILDSAELSQLCAQSVLVKSKPSPVRTWLLKWKRVPWTQHLSGRILKPSLGKSFAAKWASSAGAFRASPGQMPASESATRTRGICSHTYSPASKSADLQLSFWKTSKEFSPPNSPETNGPTPPALLYCSMSLGSWSEQVTLARGVYLARLKSVLRTNASESSSSGWNTPRVSTAGDCPSERNRHSPSLETQALANWYTPDCSDRRSAACRQQGLSNQVAEMVAASPAGPQDPGNLNTPGNPPELLRTENCCSENSKPSNWSTPIAGDWKGQKKADGSEQMLCAQVTKFQTKGQLNPRWVELLMDLPIGWTRPSALIQELTNSGS